MFFLHNSVVAICLMKTYVHQLTAEIYQYTIQTTIDSRYKPSPTLQIQRSLTKSQKNVQGVVCFYKKLTIVKIKFASHFTRSTRVGVNDHTYRDHVLRELSTCAVYQFVASFRSPFYLSFRKPRLFVQIK